MIVLTTPTSASTTDTITFFGVLGFILSSTIYFISYYVWYDILNFHTIEGRIMSTISLVVILIHPYLPNMFKFGWSILAILPIIVPESTNDFDHSIGAISLTIPLLLISPGHTA